MCGIAGVLIPVTSSLYDCVRAGDISAMDFGVCLAEELQHRGQRGVGGASWHENKISEPFSRPGSVSQVFYDFFVKKVPVASVFPGNVALAQTLYSTHAGTPGQAQPIHFTWCEDGSQAALSHNGNIVNLGEISNKTGRSYADISDSFAIADMIAREKAPDFISAVRSVLQQLRGSFSLIIIHNGSLIFARDRYGFLPLQFGRRDDGTWLVASEGYGFDRMGGSVIRDVRPGELISIDPNGMSYHEMWHERPLLYGLWGFTYFDSPASIIHGTAVNLARFWMGYELARCFDVERIPQGAILTPVPNSGDHSTQGFYRGLIDFHGRCDVEYNPTAIYRPHFSNEYANERSFIKEEHSERISGVQRKLRGLGTVVKGKWVICDDDTLVRSVTSRSLILGLERAGAKGVILAIPSAQVRYPDYYGGIDPREPERLAARQFHGDTAKMAEDIGAYYIQFLPLDAQKRAVVRAAQQTRDLGFVPPLQINQEQLTENSLYAGMFDGIYPDGIPDTL